MPLIPFADIDALPAEAREAYDRLPVKINIFRMWAHAPEMFRQGLRLGGAILGRQKLSADLRELVILLAAKLDGGEYEWAQHVSIALRCGCTQAQIDALERGDYAADCFDAKTKALVEFTVEVVRDAKGSEAALRAMQTYFSAQEIVEVILTAGFYMTLARLTETTGVEIDAPGGMAVVEALQALRE